MVDLFLNGFATMFEIQCAFGGLMTSAAFTTFRPDQNQHHLEIGATEEQVIPISKAEEHSKVLVPPQVQTTLNTGARVAEQKATQAHTKTGGGAQLAPSEKSPKVQNPVERKDHTDGRLDRSLRGLPKRRPLTVHNPKTAKTAVAIRFKPDMSVGQSGRGRTPARPARAGG